MGQVDHGFSLRGVALSKYGYEQAEAQLQFHQSNNPGPLDVVISFGALE